MVEQPAAPRERGPVESVPIDEAYLSIPDEENEAISDARATFDIALISVVVFIAIVIVFVF